MRGSRQGIRTLPKEASAKRVVPALSYQMEEARFSRDMYGQIFTQLYCLGLQRHPGPSGTGLRYLRDADALPAQRVERCAHVR